MYILIFYARKLQECCYCDTYNSVNLFVIRAFSYLVTVRYDNKTLEATDYDDLMVFIFLFFRVIITLLMQSSLLHKTN